MERQKVELENADIVAMVRGVDIEPDDFAAFVRMFKAQHGISGGGVIPDLDFPSDDDEVNQNDEEDLTDEN